MMHKLASKPLEWTGHPQLSASPPQASCLPLRGSVVQTSLMTKSRQVIPSWRALQGIPRIYRKCASRSWGLALPKPKTIIQQRALFDAYTLTHQGI